MRRHQALHHMEADMAPPHKRRRLTDSSSSSSPRHYHFASAEPMPTPSHAVKQLDRRPSLALIPRPVPQRIDEVHLQIQRRSIEEHHGHHQLLRRQQGTGVSSLADSTLTVTVLQWADPTGGTALSTINDDLGGTYATTQTMTLVSSPLPTSTTEPANPLASPTDAGLTTSSSTPADGFIGNSPGSTATPTTSSASVSGFGSAAVTASSGVPGVIAGSISTSSATNVTQTESTSSSPAASSASASGTASLPPGVYLATLSNGDVVSVTRSDEPYVTTFSDGRVSTISPLSSRPGSTESSRTSSQDRATSSEPEIQKTSSSLPQSTETSLNLVAGPTQTQQNAASPTIESTTTSSAAAGGGGGSDTQAPAGTIAGGVVGGCAGLAVILLVALVLLRWWKRKAQNGHHALPPSSDFISEPDLSSTRGQPGMAERAGLRPLVTAIPAFLRHIDRSSEASSVPSSERGFMRVSGRKLPSQFSAGMTASSSSPLSPGPPQMMPVMAPGARTPESVHDFDHERNLSSTSFYRDSVGFYGGTGESPNHNSAKNAPAPTNPFSSPGAAHSPSPSESLSDTDANRRVSAYGPTTLEEMTLSPGPRRTPTVHKGGPYTLSPPSTVPGTPNVPISPSVYSPTTHGFPGKVPVSPSVYSPTTHGFPRNVPGGNWGGQSESESGDRSSGSGGETVRGESGVFGDGDARPQRSETPTSILPDDRSSRFAEVV